MCDDIGDLYLEEVADFGRSDIIVPDFMKKCDLCGLSHRTGRKCEKQVTSVCFILFDIKSTH